MRILFMTLLTNGDINGGYTYRKSMAKVLEEIVGKENLDIVNSQLDKSNWPGNIIHKTKYFSKKDKIINFLSGNITQLSSADCRFFSRLINDRKYDFVFLGCSEGGKLAKIARKKGLKVITIFNDIVFNAVDNKMKSMRFLKKLLYFPIAQREKKSEFLTIKYSNCNIVLNERDSKLFNDIWKVYPTAISPICIEDKYKKSSLNHMNSQFTLLFVGSYNWWPNIEGITWFCENVMPMLDSDIVLRIVGFNMEQLSNKLGLNGNVRVIGTVEDLGLEYENADLVVAPILSGDGMKTKTAEALMYGKNIVASPEALEGFVGLDNSLCVTVEDYKNRINEFRYSQDSKFNIKNRELYEMNYSVSSAVERIHRLLSECED